VAEGIDIEFLTGKRRPRRSKAGHGECHVHSCLAV
jgi:hypothetical protein